MVRLAPAARQAAILCRMGLANPEHPSDVNSQSPALLRRTALDWALDPEAVALLVRDDKRPFALIGRWAGGGAVIGSDPLVIADPDEDPFALLDQQPHVITDADPDQPIKTNVQFNGIGGGWFGYLGYQLGARVEPVGPPPPTGARL